MISLLRTPEIKKTTKQTSTVNHNGSEISNSRSQNANNLTHLPVYYTTRRCKAHTGCSESLYAAPDYLHNIFHSGGILWPHSVAVCVGQ